MRLALERLAKAVGSGSTIPAHAYVAHVDGTLYVTDGRQFASTPSDSITAGNFCVKHDALLRALSRDNATLSVDAAGDVVVRYAGERGRFTLKTLPIDSVVRMPMEADNWITLENGTSFVETIRFLRKFCGSPDGQAWATGIHFGPDFAFAASNQYFARKDVSFFGDEVLTLPPWAADFILSLTVPPTRVAIEGTAVFVDWGSVSLLSTLLAQDAPESAWSIASNVPLLTEAHAIPLGLQETMERAREEGLTTVHIGNGKAHATLDYGEFEESVAITSDAKLWNTAYMLAALEHATMIDLSGPHAFWNGPGCRGMIAGMMG